MNAHLVRVGIDSTDASGGFNAPMNPETKEFAYVPIIEPRDIIGNLNRTFQEFKDPCRKLGLSLPSRLWNKNAHVDPDFSELTYGDVDGTDVSTGKNNHRGRPLRNAQENDILVFYAGLREIHKISNHGRIVDAIIGLYVVQESVSASKFAKGGSNDGNAHTRCEHNDADIVIIAKRTISGRLDKCIPIGEYRDNAHRVSKNILADWGDLYVNDGYIQRSARLPKFKDPERFYKWFNEHIVNQRINLIPRNN
jgi:hypothetical protein